MRSSTLYGGKAVATVLAQKIADEEKKKSLFDNIDIPQVKREDLDEKFLTRENEILSQYAPALLEKPNLKEPQAESEKIQENQVRLDEEHGRRVGVTKEYRGEETGMDALGQIALLGGFGYDDPHERLKEKQENP